MNRPPDKPVLRQVACLLLASVSLGLASNALNPTGLRWGTSNDGSRGGEGPKSSGTAEIYRNETLYEHQTSYSGREPSIALTAAHDLYSSGAAPMPGAPRRSTWMEIKPLVESGQLVLVDARPRNAFDAGHIPAAVN